MVAELLRAIALVLIIEGLMPFIAPQAWREAVLRLASMDPRYLRIFGATLIALGVVLLQFVH